MLARIRKSMEDKDQGFTLIELLVVMIIIGILAAIAIPVFLNQRKKAVDTAAKSDVSTIGKEVATYYVDGTTDPTLAVVGRPLPASTRATSASRAPAWARPTLSYATATPATPHSSGWCVTLPITGGTLTNVYYSAHERSLDRQLLT